MLHERKRYVNMKNKDYMVYSFNSENETICETLKEARTMAKGMSKELGSAIIRKWERPDNYSDLELVEDWWVKYEDGKIENEML